MNKIIYHIYYIYITHPFNIFLKTFTACYYCYSALPEHLSSPPAISGIRVTRSLVLCICFIDCWLSFWTLSFGHCVVCSSSICGFWLPLWYLQTLLTTTGSMSLLVDFNDTEQQCLISKCRTKNCKTCNILITDVHNTSNLTNKSYVTRSYDDLNCKSANVVYWLECILCGLVHVGETKDKLHKRICGHRSGNINVNDILYQHFNQPDHSVLSMRVRIIEKICHRTNNPNLATPFRRQNEDYWMRELGTATPYGCNDKIDGISISSSPTCRPMNVMDICNSAPLRKRSHGHRH